MESHDAYRLGAIFSISVATMVSIVGYSWLNRPRGGSTDNRQLADIADRLARLEGAVDAIAVETERISEGQRFTTKLLAGRSETPAGSPRS